jgi:hypothetical protein
MYIKKLKEMFTEMVQKKDATLIPFYYHQDLILTANGQVTDYAYFLKQHEEYYASERTYSVEYDEATLLEQGEKIAGRIWIMVSVPGETPKKIEVVLVAQYKEEKIYRLWELTYPDWSKLPEFQE